MWQGVTAALLTLLPGLLAWWWGRALVRLGDDAALPERLTEHRSRLTLVAAVVMVAEGILVTPWVLWAYGLMLLALLAGGFPMRRTLYGETWRFPAYVAHTVRLALGLLGFWLLLACAPSYVPAEGPARWPAIVGLAALLLAWEARYSAVLLWLLGATPLDRADLAPRFAAILARSRIAPPLLYRAGTPGGRLANAFALASSRGSAVLITDPLLELLQPDEVAAIFAHEVAHLEHYDRRRLARLRGATWLAILAGVPGVPLLQARLPDSASLIGLGWGVAVFGAFFLRAAAHKAHESWSDRRAVELCGDSDAVGRALVKLHRLARLPRRWAIAAERTLSHPSLARRLQAIRDAAGAPAAALELPRAFASRKPGRFLVLHANRLQRVSGIPAGTPADPAILGARPATETVPYGELTDLRVQVGITGSASLTGSSRSGATWSVPLRPEDVGTVQSVLDAVDGQLGRAPVGLVHHPALLVALTLLGLCFGYGASNALAALVLGSVLLVRPGPAPLAAYGAVTLAAALAALLGPWATWYAMPLGASPAAAAITGGLALALALARIRGGERSRAGEWAAGIGLGLIALVTALPLLATAAAGGGAVRLHQAAMGPPAFTVALLGLAAMLATRPRARARAVAAGLALLAVLPVGLGSHWFLDRFGRDPFLGTAARLDETGGSLRLLGRTPLGVSARRLRLSPSGTRYTVVGLTGPLGRRVPANRVGAFSGGSREIEGAAIRFLSDDRLLALAGSDGGRELQLVNADDPRIPVWRRPLPSIDTRDLAIDPATGAWQALALSFEPAELVLITGTGGGHVVGETRLPLPDRVDPEDLLYITAPGAALALDASYTETPRLPLRRLGRLAQLVQWIVSPAFHPRSDVWLLAPGGSRHLLTSELDVQCLGPTPAGTGFVCLSWDGPRTWLWRIDPESGDRHCIGWIPGSLSGPVLAGGRLAAWIGTEAVLVDLSAPRIRRLPLPPGSDRPHELALAGDRLAVLSRHADRAQVTLYAVE